MPLTPLEGFCVSEGRVSEALGSLLFPVIEESFRVTVSIGVAEYHRDESTDDTLLWAHQPL